MIAGSVFMVVFRLLHIFGGIFWVGAVAMFALFISPAATEVGPAAGPFVANLILKRRVVRVIAGSGAVTILAGAAVYWHDWDASGSLAKFLDGSFGVVLTIGAAFALVGFVVGVSVVLPGVEAAVRLGGQIAGTERPPPELLERMRALQLRNGRASRTVLALLVIASASMATARYW